MLRFDETRARSLQRRSDDRLRPAGRAREVVRVPDLSLLHVQHQRGLGRPSLRGIGLGAVVVDAQARELRQQVNEVQPAVLVAPADVAFGNVVPAGAHPRAHARDVQLGTGEADVQEMHRRALFRALSEELRERISAQRGLEGEVEPLRDRALEQPAALVPGGGVGLGLLHARPRGHHPARGLVGVVVLAAELAYRSAAYAALARAVDAGEDVDAVRFDYLRRRLRADRTAAAL